jgi:hypothetical protein
MFTSFTLCCVHDVHRRWVCIHWMRAENLIKEVGKLFNTEDKD